jgi:hypothetical protein
VTTNICCVQNPLHWNLPHVGQFMYIILLLYWTCLCTNILMQTQWEYIFKHWEWLYIHRCGQACLRALSLLHTHTAIPCWLWLSSICGLPFMPSFANHSIYFFFLYPMFEICVHMEKISGFETKSSIFSGMSGLCWGWNQFISSRSSSWLAVLWHFLYFMISLFL